MDEHSTSLLNRVSDEPVWDSKELFGVFFIVVMQINIQILKILLSFCVLFWAYIQNMSNPKIQNVLCFEACDEVAIE